MRQVHQVNQYLRYLIRGQSKYYLHSPFVYQFAEEVLHDKRYFHVFDDIKALRKKLLAEKQSIFVEDFGAGQSRERAIKEIAKNAAIKDKYGRLLFRLVYHFQPPTMLELGTSLGIGTLFHKKGHGAAQMTTIEGAQEVAAIAQQSFGFLKENDIQQLIGPFEEQLPAFLKNIKKLDYVFFDGNHRKDPTLQYFNWCLKHVQASSIFVFDDIHWSPEMTEAWDKICQHPQVTLSLDLFQLGILFFHKGQSKEHFTLWY